MKNMLSFLVIVTLLFSTNCQTKKQSSAGQSNVAKATATKNGDEIAKEELELKTNDNFPYQLNEPDATFELPNKLKEISGLGIDETSAYLYAIQDEEGDLFKINAKTGVVEEAIEFHKDGDYEGVEWVKGKAYVVKSSGTLYEVVNWGTDKQERFKHKFDFHKNSDVEALGYDPTANRLLIGCKGKAGKGDAFDFKKGIFAFALDSMQLTKDPVYTISVEEVKQFLEVNKTLEKIEKLVKLFQPGEEFIFGPSGLAVHPMTGDIYITSSVGKLLIVLNRNGVIKHVVKLKKKVHEQPEGITFAQDGTLYISNEGKGGKGRIYRFDYRKIGN